MQEQVAQHHKTTVEGIPTSMWDKEVQMIRTAVGNRINTPRVKAILQNAIDRRDTNQLWEYWSQEVSGAMGKHISQLAKINGNNITSIFFAGYGKTIIREENVFQPSKTPNGTSNGISPNTIMSSS